MVEICFSKTAFDMQTLKAVIGEMDSISFHSHTYIYKSWRYIGTWELPGIKLSYECLPRLILGCAQIKSKTYAVSERVWCIFYFERVVTYAVMKYENVWNI